MKNHPLLLAVTGLMLLGAFAGCSSTPPVEAVPTQTEVANDNEDSGATTSEEPEPPQAEPGTRENPLAVGEMRKISQESMWTVGAEAPTVVSDTMLRLPLYLQLDWEACEAQASAAGGPSCSEEGVNPFWLLTIDYVTGGGKSYNTLDYVENMDWETELSNLGEVYPPLPEIHSHYSVTVPAAEHAGGVWKISNSAGDAVYVASGL